MLERLQIARLKSSVLVLRFSNRLEIVGAIWACFRYGQPKPLQSNSFAAPNKMPEEADLKSKPIQGLAAEIQVYSAEVAAFRTRAGTFGQRIAAKINEVDPSDCDNESEDQLQRVRLDLYAVIEKLDATIRQFENRRKSVSACSSANKDQVAIQLYGSQGNAVESFSSTC